jgi:hypothetical protein
MIEEIKSADPSIGGIIGNYTVDTEGEDGTARVKLVEDEGADVDVTYVVAPRQLVARLNQ